MHRKTSMTRVAPALVAGALIFGFAACGGDDDDDAGGDTTAAPATTGAATETSGATETTAATEGTEGGAAGEASVEAFCEAELAAEAAASGEDPSAAGPAFEALVAASPEEIKPAVEEVIANAETGPGTPAFDEPYAEMIGFVKDNCGFGEINVTAADYSYTGLEAEYRRRTDDRDAHQRRRRGPRDDRAPGQRRRDRDVQPRSSPSRRRKPSRRSPSRAWRSPSRGRRGSARSTSSQAATSECASFRRARRPT